MSRETLIVGAGAAGLIAARRLAAAGYSVTVLEAAAVPGGRIHTLSVPGFAEPVEAGAEFVHGDLPITLGIAHEAGRALIRSHHEQMTADDRPAAGETDWDELMSAMRLLDKDMPVAEFLDTHFAGEKYAALRESVRGFAEGFDLADLATASTKALHAEWSGEENSSEYRVEGGYGGLVDFLVRDATRLGAILHFSAPVTDIRWQKGRVVINTAAGVYFQASCVLVTVSLGALARLVWQPAITAYTEAAARIGYGSVIKILIEFRTAFWRVKKPGGTTLFILSRQPVPTWWTQPGDTSRLLTGWLTAENMRRFLALDEKGRTARCLASLAAIFAMDVAVLRAEMVAIRIFDWEQQPFVHGGYSFDTVMTPEARRLLRKPVEETLYFAGEAVDEGYAPGTVEAAFHSGLDAAEKIIARDKPRY